MVPLAEPVTPSGLHPTIALRGHYKVTGVQLSGMQIHTASAFARHLLLRVDRTNVLPTPDANAIVWLSVNWLSLHILTLSSFSYLGYPLSLFSPCLGPPFLPRRAPYSRHLFIAPSSTTHTIGELCAFLALALPPIVILRVVQTNKILRSNDITTRSIKSVFFFYLSFCVSQYLEQCLVHMHHIIACCVLYCPNHRLRRNGDSSRKMLDVMV